jgi:hypothetical protein
VGIEGRGTICALERELLSEGIQIILCLGGCSGVKGGGTVAGGG